MSDRRLKMPYLFFCQAHFMLFILKIKQNDVNQNKGEKTLKIYQCDRKLTFWFILIENSDKLKSKNTLRVEIDQFFDG